MTGGNGRVDQRFYAPIGKPGSMGAWRVVIWEQGVEGGQGARVERVVVASSLVPVIEHYGDAAMEAEYLGEGECLLNIGTPESTAEVTEV